MTKKIDLSRREFIRNTTLFTTAGSIAAPFALNMFAMNVAAAFATTGTTDYKALVCIYLGGGNDHNNMVLATDDASWAGYTEARNRGGSVIALTKSATTVIAPSTKQYDTQGVTPVERTFMLHPAMGLMKGLFDAGRAAIVANVGPLIEPIINRQDYRDNPVKRPMNLFSHSDQTAQWHSTDPSKPIYGWGGRMADIFQSANNSAKLNYSSSISTAGNTIFLAGQQIHQYQISANGSATAVGGLTSSLFGATTSNLQKIITTPINGNIFEIAHADVVKRAIAAQADLQAILDATRPTDPIGTAAIPAPTQYQNPNNQVGTLSNNSLAIQLHTVARIIAGQNKLGAKRQVFFVNMGGFDTHDGQAPSHADLMTRLAHGMSYFDTTLKTLSVLNAETGHTINNDLSSKVTAFTASDFGRTFTSNGDGTDHGWGAHHFVVGGAVNGGNIYGSFPVTAVHDMDNLAQPGVKFVNLLDVGSGSTIPQISVDQYAATMAKWFGLNDGEINSIFPKLPNFNLTTPLNSINYRDLGFMNPLVIV